MSTSGKDVDGSDEGQEKGEHWAELLRRQVSDDALASSVSSIFDPDDWIVHSILRTRQKRSEEKVDLYLGEDATPQLEYLIQWLPPRAEYDDYSARSHAQFWTVPGEDDEEDEELGGFPLGPRGRELIDQFNAETARRRLENESARAESVKRKIEVGIMNRFQTQWDRSVQFTGKMTVPTFIDRRIPNYKPPTEWNRFLPVCGPNVPNIESLADGSAIHQAKTGFVSANQSRHVISTLWNGQRLLVIQGNDRKVQFAELVENRLEYLFSFCPAAYVTGMAILQDSLIICHFPAVVCIYSIAQLLELGEEKNLEPVQQDVHMMLSGRIFTVFDGHIHDGRCDVAVLDEDEGIIAVFNSLRCQVRIFALHDHFGEPMVNYRVLLTITTGRGLIPAAGVTRPYGANYPRTPESLVDFVFSMEIIAVKRLLGPRLAVNDRSGIYIVDWRLGQVGPAYATMARPAYQRVSAKFCCVSNNTLICALNDDNDRVQILDLSSDLSEVRIQPITTESPLEDAVAVSCGFLLSFADGTGRLVTEQCETICDISAPAVVDNGYAIGAKISVAAEIGCVIFLHGNSAAILFGDTVVAKSAGKR